MYSYSAVPLQVLFKNKNITIKLRFMTQNHRPTCSTTRSELWRCGQCRWDSGNNRKFFKSSFYQGIALLKCLHFVKNVTTFLNKYQNATDLCKCVLHSRIFTLLFIYKYHMISFFTSFLKEETKHQADVPHFTGHKFISLNSSIFNIYKKSKYSDVNKMMFVCSYPQYPK